MKNQPKIEIPGSVLEAFLNAVSVLVFLMMFVYLLFHYNALPDQVPSHYNAAGEPDGWGRKTELFLLPIIAAALWSGMTVLEKYPHSYNYLNLTEENIEAQYSNGRLMINVLKNEISILFSFITVQSVRVATGAADGLGSFFMPVFLTVILVTGIYFIGRMLRN
ncbi:DUF1648 domain-containing protein [Planococcus sp. SE5232]|uniref:DUF1648 domain-containing protein n=1 Tax=unclassified Planococcus (in: firmicutes) TaxID=2662419 RepID=UPI001CBB2438|nr:DUF1648 domain-containing protein [Planococcus sp. 4-30]